MLLRRLQRFTTIHKRNFSALSLKPNLTKEQCAELHVKMSKYLEMNPFNFNKSFFDFYDDAIEEITAKGILKLSTEECHKLYQKMRSIEDPNTPFSFYLKTAQEIRAETRRKEKRNDRICAVIIILSVITGFVLCYMESKHYYYDDDY
uniref:Uncharacterized protein n=1 Tax=viral metagenome TaxID=1070528 RepID=A0A6C0CAK8_9ZZZZ